MAQSNPINIGITTTADGGVVVDLDTRRKETRAANSSDKFDENLVDSLPQEALTAIEAELHEGVDADEASRQSWVDNYNEGLSMLGLLLEKPAQLNNNTSTVRHPMLAWAIVEFQALMNGELLPASGPVKIENDSEEMPQEVADALERDMNHYLKTTASEYYPDTDRGIYFLGYGGTIFKKVFRCPLRRRPVSETVYMTDLIISNDTTVLSQARRVTHQVEGWSRNRILQMIDAGWWADVPVMYPVMNPSKTRSAMARVSGVTVVPTLSSDQTHTIRECHTWLDLGRWGQKEKGTTEGLELPYVVTSDRDTRQVYAIRRNWRKDGDPYQPRKRFVKWGMIPGIGYLDQGYLNLLGNPALAATALLRILIDAGIYSIFPGGVRKKGLRLDTNQIRPSPGEFMEIETGDLPINAAIMALPFKGPAGEVLALLQHMEELAQKVMGTVNTNTKEGVKDIPVGTIMTMVEQAAQIQIAVHKRVHNGQKEEFQLLRDEFMDMGEEGLLLLKQRNQDQPYTAEQLYSAALIPSSDPEVPAYVHRYQQATALDALSAQNPDLYDRYAVQRRLLEMGRITGIDELLVRPQPQGDAPPDPTMLAIDLQKQLGMAELKIKAEDIAGKQKIAEIKAALEKWIAEQKNEREERQSEAETTRVAVEADAEKQKTDAERDAETLAAAQEQEAAAQDRDAETLRAAEQAEAELTKQEMQIESNEAIAAMHDQTTLIVEGMREDQAPTEEKPARDKKSGP